MRKRKRIRIRAYGSAPYMSLNFDFCRIRTRIRRRAYGSLALFCVDGHVMHCRMPNIPGIAVRIDIFRRQKQVSLSRYTYTYPYRGIPKVKFVKHGHNS